MPILQKQYDVETNKFKEEIFDSVKKKVESQKKSSSFLSFDLVDYRNFKLNTDQIEIERWPSMINPFRGIGTIWFDFYDLEGGTKIKCTIEPFSKFAILLWFGFMAFILTAFTLLAFLVVTENHLKVYSVFLLIWILCLGFPFLILLYYRNALEEYSRTILSDLDIN